MSSRAARSSELQQDGEEEQGAEQQVRVKKFDLGIFYLVAESFGDATYSNLAKNLLQRSPPTSALRSAHVSFKGRNKAKKADKKGGTGDPTKHVVYHLPEEDEYGHLIWDHSTFKLPTERDKESFETRMCIFKFLDEGGDGSVSLQELKSFLPKMVAVPGTDDAKKFLGQAVDFANSALSEMSMGRKRQQDVITKKEFRVFLVFLQRYCGIYELFLEMDLSVVDEGGDQQITLDEFTAAIPKLVAAGFSSAELFANPIETFQKIDGDGSGLISFPEFANFCVRQGLDAEMDG